MNNQETVCAVVVTYNRKDTLVKCLESLINQTRHLNAICIVDNGSKDGTPEFLVDNGYINGIPPNNLDHVWEKTYKIVNITDNGHLKIHYVRMHENTGGAGGFHEGIKTAYKKGYDWIWSMDDDIKSDPNCLKNLLKNTDKSKVLLPIKLSEKMEIEELSATIYNLKNPFLNSPREVIVSNYYKNFLEMPETIKIQEFTFEGPFIHRSIVKKVGYPKKDLFIRGDDTEYALRIRYHGNEDIILVRDAIFYRIIPISELEKINWKSYYGWRNEIYLHYIYGENILVKIKHPYVILKFIITILIMNGFDKEVILMAFYAFIDAWKNELPNRYKPFI